MPINEDEHGVAEPRQLHHEGFNEALDDAVDKWAQRVSQGTTDDLIVTLRVRVSRTNPGRIEKYSVELGSG
jgi:hypothetical protein